MQFPPSTGGCPRRYDAWRLGTMRFGHFFYPMKFDDSRDEQEIQACLDEAQLVEELGLPRNRPKPTPGPYRRLRLGCGANTVQAPTWLPSRAF